MYVAPEPKIDFSPMVVLNDDDLIEIGHADSIPTSIEKQKVVKAARSRKADMNSFDREKFYKRLGINQDATKSDEIEMLEVEPVVCETVSDE